MLMLVVSYVCAGHLVAAALARRGATLDVCAAALVAWPLQLHLLGADEAPVLALPALPAPLPGPHGPVIDRAFAGVTDALVRTGSERQEWTADLGALARALHAADARLAVVDGILADAGREPVRSQRLDQSLSELAAVRARADGEIEAVVTELTRLRVQIGIVTLSGDTLPVRDGLRALTARVTTLGELASMTMGEVV